MFLFDLEHMQKNMFVFDEIFFINKKIGYIKVICIQKNTPGSFLTQYLSIISFTIYFILSETFIPNLVSLILETLKYWVGVQLGNLTSWGEGASLALVGSPSSDGVTIKMPYGIDVFTSTSFTPHLFLMALLSDQLRLA